MPIFWLDLGLAQSVYIRKMMLIPHWVLEELR